MSTLVDLKISQPDNTAEAKAKQALERAEAMPIQTAGEYEAAADELRAIKAKWKEIDDSRKALKAPVDQAAARIQAFFKPPLGFLSSAETVLKRKMVAWKDDQDRITREEQRKADERARKERDRLERAAAKAEQDGRTGRAEILRDRAEATVPDMPPPAVPKVPGISDLKVMQFEIIDPKKIPREFTIPDEKRIRRFVNAMRTDADIPGVRIWEESSLAARKGQ